MSTDDVLSSIDEALWWEENWEEASAMRWNADLPEENRLVAPGYTTVVITADTSAFESAMIEVTRQVNRMFERMQAAMRPFAEAFAKIIARMASSVSLYDEHHPEPLVFQGRPFGAEYARRRKARGRRG